MNTKNKIIFSILALSVAFGAGRWSITQSKTEISQTDTKEENKQIHTHKTVTETKQSDGTVLTITTTDQDVGDIKTENRETADATVGFLFSVLCVLFSARPGVTACLLHNDPATYRHGPG